MKIVKSMCLRIMGSIYIFFFMKGMAQTDELQGWTKGVALLHLSGHVRQGVSTNPHPVGDAQ